MKQIATLGIALMLTASGCEGTALAGGSATPASATPTKPAAAWPLRLAFHHVHIAGASEADAREIVCRTEAELAAALKDRGLDQLPDGPETVAKALKAVDFSKETAILIDQGLQPSMTQSVEPVGAEETPQGIVVRFTKRHSEIDLPALNRPYAILAIPKTTKPVAVEVIGAPSQPGQS
jgi:hypothetical protein